MQCCANGRVDMNGRCAFLRLSTRELIRSLHQLSRNFSTTTHKCEHMLKYALNTESAVGSTATQTSKNSSSCDVVSSLTAFAFLHPLVATYFRQLRQVVKVTGVPTTGMTMTVLLRGSNRLVLDEAERSVHDALCVVRSLVSASLSSPKGAPFASATLRNNFDFQLKTQNCAILRRRPVLCR